MRYAFIKCEDLTGPAFRGAEPVDRATWLCLLAWCYEHENGGRIVGAKTWGDRRWQQTLAVTLKEVNREAPGLWSWEGDDLVVQHYDHAYVDQVRGDSRQGTAGGRATSPAKAEAARRNGMLGGARKEPNTNPTTNPTGTQQHTQHDSPPNPSEPKPVCQSVCQSVSQSISAAAAASVVPGNKPPPPQRPRGWREWQIKVGIKCFIGDGEDEAWKLLYEAEGWDEMTRAYVYLAKTKPGGRLFLSDFQACREDAHAK